MYFLIGYILGLMSAGFIYMFLHFRHSVKDYHFEDKAFETLNPVRKKGKFRPKSIEDSEIVRREQKQAPADPQ